MSASQISEDKFRKLLSDPRYADIVREKERKVRISILGKESNKERDTIKRNSLLQNLSITEILVKISDTFNGFLDDVLSGKNIFKSFSRNDRLIYWGILMLLLSIFLMLVKFTDLTPRKLV